MAKRWGLAVCATALVAASGSASAQERERSWRDFAGVTNTSFVEGNGDRAIQLSIDVPAPQRAVFDAFATSEGFASWAVPVAKVDLRIGGMIESNYNPAARMGERDNIKNEIVAYVPSRLIVLRNVQAPRTFVHPELFQKTVTIVEFAAIDPSHTRVTMTNSGYGPGPDFDKIYKLFEWGDAYSLAGLRRRFEQGPVDWTKGEPQLDAASAANRFKGGDK
ncbi:MAG: SRPBCC domain-containing protein [Sphingomonas sp.]|uniref:SRPBCC family protein n=1 Tax=Sphingomonas sp. TaxID=28214 RepID=UPI0011FB3A34|nr:SRPBCC domain-containing protein [Sphingomonas sp.]THD34484.1 MAG: SRPBCC domain-containing protein [Sphingomonas sp.]